MSDLRRDGVRDCGLEQVTGVTIGHWTLLHAASAAFAPSPTRDRLTVGAGRVYLGVHWPSDVLAGWCLGALWAILCWSALAWLTRRGHDAALLP